MERPEVPDLDPVEAAPATTCWFVTIWPFLSSTNPEPCARVVGSPNDDAALVADAPVPISGQQRRHRLRRRFDLNLIGIAPVDHLFRQSVGGEK